MYGPNLKLFGITASGEKVFSIMLKNKDLACEIMTYGATVHTLFVPRSDGGMVDVVLGYDTLEEYERQDGYLGATIGRFSNRIAGGRFFLNAKSYALATNDGKNHLHGGNIGFSHRIWTIEECGVNRVCLSLLSRDGEEGYPGNLRARVVYALEDKALIIRYHATSDMDTICSLTNHSYFNLAGYDTGPVYDQEIQIHASRFTPSDPHAIPIGTLAPVADTPMDFVHYTRIGQRIDSNFPQIKQFGGYDHNYAIDGQIGILRPAVNARCVATGIAMQVETTSPGVQFCTGNSLNEGRRGKSGSTIGPHHGFCLETQFFPDAPNHANFPSARLKAGEYFDHTTIFSFSTL